MKSSRSHKNKAITTEASLSTKTRPAHAALTAIAVIDYTCSIIGNKSTNPEVREEERNPRREILQEDENENTSKILLDRKLAASSSSNGVGREISREFASPRLVFPPKYKPQSCTTRNCKLHSIVQFSIQRTTPFLLQSA